jgi:hypothetical protein
VSSLPFSIRDYKPDDYAFILSSWSNEAHKIKYDNFIPNSIFFPRQKQLINNIIAKSIIKIAYLDDEENIIGGYLILQPEFRMNTLLIHWAGTKPIYRRLGIFDMLLSNYIDNASPILVSSSPFSLFPIFQKKYNLIYDPSSIDQLRGING